MAYTKIALTGANGFIGSHLLRTLIKQGHRPVVLLEKGTSRKPIEDLEDQYDAVIGDLLDSASLEPLIGNADSVIHLAGLNRYWAKDPSIFARVNVEGTRHVADLCLRYGIKKLIHASSCITCGASDSAADLRNEDSGYNLRKLRFQYGETKTAGEELIRDYVKNRGLPAVIINPTSAIGERDYGPTPIGKPIADIARGMWPVYVGGGACFIDVHDVVRAILLALERARVGSQYLLVGENLTNREFMTRVAECAGVRPPKVKIPRPLLSAIGRAAEILADHVTQKHPPVTAGMAGLVGRYLFFDGGRAKLELGFEAGSCTPAIERSVRWFREVSPR